MLRSALAAALSAALLLPGVAAADVEGSDLSRADESTWSACPAGPCTIASSADGWFRPDVEDHGIVTSWTAKLAPNTVARLRLLRVADDGSMTSVGASATVTGSAAGGVQAFPTHLVAPEGWVTIGVDVVQGAVGVVADDDYGTKTFSPLFGEGEARTAAFASDGDELLLQARGERDEDRDGKGDETEDDCVWGCDPLPSTPSPSTPSTPATPSTPSTPPPPSSPSAPKAGDDEPAKPPFTIDPRGMVRPGAQADQGLFDLYAANNASGTVTAKITVKDGRRTVGTKTLEIEYGDDDWATLELNAKERRKLLKAGRLKLSVSAVVQREGGATTRLEQPLTVVTGGDARYDGRYVAPGPFVITVDHGAIRSVSGSVNAFCPATNRFQMLSYFTLDGFPVLIGKDGTFDVTGNAVSQQMTYRGKLSVRGKSTGYASVFKSQLNISGGRYIIDACQGATNWTATRAR
jgi:hypothetical protein